MHKRRLFIVANRLPVTISEEKGAQPCAGGLVTAITSYLNYSRQNDKEQFDEIYWAGVPGCSTSLWEEMQSQLICSNFNLIPVFVNPNDYDGYYNGFSNSVLWPLFHYFPSYAEYNANHYAQYTLINKRFAETLSKYAQPNDVIWIHDYHLLPLAKQIRAICPAISIGFFLHIPFPSFEIFRLLPRSWQEELLQGLLGADLIGFHTIDYASHFLQTLQMVLGIDNEQHIVCYEDRLIKVDVFPISIDYECFYESFDREPVKNKREYLSDQFHGKKLLFSIDRLDYTKGVYNRLLAFEVFLKRYPQYVNKVHLIVVVVPSRDSIGKYAERKRMIDEVISRINSMAGNIQWQPVLYQYTSLPFDEMMALYTIADIALVTPIRDGMNLIAKEYVASRKDGKGVLLLSEMAGAARELTDAVFINPNDIGEMADKIKLALEMSLPEQKKRIRQMQSRIQSYDVNSWAEDFLTQLQAVKDRQFTYQVAFLDEYTRKHLLEKYNTAHKRLILLDYDGTLVHFTTFPEEAQPSVLLLETIKGLCREPLNDVHIISGRNSAFLQKWFGNLRINLIAEHGAMIRTTSGEWSSKLSYNEVWKEHIGNIMQQYVKRCPHTFIELKDFSIVWHYRNANVDQAKLRSAELIAELNEYTRKQNLQVLLGNKIIEVRKQGIDKGSTIQPLLDKQHYDFILAAGDDTTDEDMFKIVRKANNSFSIKIGSSASFAAYNLLNVGMFVSLLEDLNHLKWPVISHD